MTRSKPLTTLAGVAALPLIALAVAACGGGGATAATPKPTTTASPAKTAGTTVSMASNPKLGRILVDSHGDTLYLFAADSRTMSACTGACATAWPPLRSTGTPKAAPGIKASLLGTIKRSDGAPQVTYNGHPLYLFIKDTKPGDTNGQGLTAFGAAWFALTPAGTQARQVASTSGSSSAKPQASAPSPAPQPTTTTPAPAAPKPAPSAAKPKPPANNGIPQNNGGDGDSDNNGGPSDGDGNI